MDLSVCQSNPLSYIWHITKNNKLTLCGKKVRIEIEKIEATAETVSGHIPMCGRCKHHWAKDEITRRIILE